ncbi:MAG: hypothetical protein JHC98_05520 [Thermoleophilaceae bacterium]|nr:hypothetical protein [Thermoleophilaceae bacterium]
MKKVGIAARLLAVAAILSLAAFAVVGCGGDDKNGSSTSNGSGTATGGGDVQSGDTVGEAKKVVVGKDGDFDAEQAAVVATLGEFADATADKNYKKLCNDILSKEAAKIGGDCVKTFEQSGAGLKDFKIVVNSVKISKDGKTATAAVDVTSNVNSANQAQNLSLVKEGGEWKVQILGQ